MKKLILITSLIFASLTAIAQEVKKEPQGHTDINKFSQMYAEMATPNMFRTASGAPGPAYYQQRADYKINLELDDKASKMYGSETVTYYNNAPESLDYLWVQLDQNIARRDSQTPLIDSQTMPQATSVENFTKTYMGKGFDGGFNLEYVKDEKGNAMKYSINNTMMRIDLPKPLKKGRKSCFFNQMVVQY